MTEQEAALIAVARLCQVLDLPYMIVGGQANVIWGEPRATLDVDVTIWVVERELPGIVAALAGGLEILPADPVAFVRDTRVLPTRTAEGVRVDVIFGMLTFEHEAIARAVSVMIAGVPVRYCAAEDLILHKIHSSRSHDLADARGVVLRQFTALDRSYLDPRIEELSRELDDPAIAARWAEWMREAATLHAE